MRIEAEDGTVLKAFQGPFTSGMSLENCDFDYRTEPAAGVSQTTVPEMSKYSQLIPLYFAVLSGEYPGGKIRARMVEGNDGVPADAGFLPLTENNDPVNTHWARFGYVIPLSKAELTVRDRIDPDPKKWPAAGTAGWRDNNCDGVVDVDGNPYGISGLSGQNLIRSKSERYAFDAIHVDEPKVPQ